jgi:hypothetical protein
MAGQRSNHEKVRYRFQKVFAGIQDGISLVVKTKRQEPVRFFMRQDSVSGSCGLMCVGMALIALGVLKASAFESAPRRRHGTAFSLWSLLSDSFFSGIDVSDLHARLIQLDVPVTFTCRTGEPASIGKFAVDSLSRGELTILAYENERNHFKHYVLGTGVAGVTENRKSTVDSLLVIDSGGDEPILTAYNGVMHLSPCHTRAKQKKKLNSRWLYETAGYASAEKVFLIGAIRCRLC